KYRTTPKAFVTLSAGQKLWGSRVGNVTSLRVNLKPETKPEELAATMRALRPGLSGALRPEDGGFAFDDVRARFAAAGQGGQDFGGLFLGFSFFLIASALLLVGLLTRLNLERRAAEIGVLLATGWRTRIVRRLLLLEGVIVAALGGLLGLVGA